MIERISDIEPLGDLVVIRELAETSSIIRPDNAKIEHRQFVVLKVGAGRVLESGARNEPQVRRGDRVVIAGASAMSLRTSQGTVHLIESGSLSAIVGTVTEDAIQASLADALTKQ